MKARVSYEDFIGTSSADISDHSDLKQFLVTRGVDVERYVAIGASFYAGYSDFFSASIICIDNEQSTENKKYIVKIGFEEDFDKDEFFDLFKRFNVVVTRKYRGYHDQEIDEEFTIDDRKQEDE
mgnify:CR=1 FL=1